MRLLMSGIVGAFGLLQEAADGRATGHDAAPFQLGGPRDGVCQCDCVVQRREKVVLVIRQTAEHGNRFETKMSSPTWEA